MASVALSTRTNLATADYADGDLIPVVDISEAAAADKTKKTTIADFAQAIENRVTPAVNAIKTDVQTLHDAVEVKKNAVDSAVASLPTLAFPSRTFIVDDAYAGFPEPAFTSVTAAVLAARAKILAEGGEMLIILRHSGGARITLSGTGYTYAGLAAESIYVSMVSDLLP